jgi:hypothetical protein
MLYCLIAWAKFLFLHLFVTIFKQLGDLLMNQLISMGDSWVCFAFVFLFRFDVELNREISIICNFGWIDASMVCDQTSVGSAILEAWAWYQH